MPTDPRHAPAMDLETCKQRLAFRGTCERRMLEWLISEVERLRSLLASSTTPQPTDLEQRRLAAYRMARIFEPSMDGYAGAMAVYNAAFPEAGIDGAAAIHVSDLTARMEAGAAASRPQPQCICGWPLGSARDPKCPVHAPTASRPEPREGEPS